METETILKALTKNEDGNLKSLNNLSMIGKEMLYCCVYLLMRSENNSLNLRQMTLPTLEYLLENENIEVNSGHVLNILSNFINNDSCLIDKAKKDEKEEIVNKLC